MFSWFLKLRKKTKGSVSAPKGTTIELGSETFLFEGLPAGQHGEPFRRVNARLCEMKTLLARQESIITVQQETIVELNSKIRILEQEVDAQTTLVDHYGEFLEKIPNLAAAFIKNQAKEVAQIPRTAEKVVVADLAAYPESSLE